MNQQIAAFSADHRREVEDLKRSHAEELMQQQAEVEERLLAEYDIKIQEVFRELKAKHEDALKVKADQVAQLQAEKAEVEELLKEERDKQAEIRRQHSRELAQLRAKFDDEKTAIHAEAQKQAEESLAHYRKLAQDALDKGHDEKAHLQAESVRAAQEAETRCQSFEAEVQRRTKDIIEEYRLAARKAQDAAAAERQELRQRVQDMEKAMDAQQAEFEVKLMQELEKRHAVSKQEVARLEAQARLERQNFERLTDELLRQMEADCRAFEADTKRKALEAIEAHRRVAESCQKSAEEQREQAMVREMRWIGMLQRQEKDNPNTARSNGQGMDSSRSGPWTPHDAQQSEGYSNGAMASHAGR